MEDIVNLNKPPELELKALIETVPEDTDMSQPLAVAELVVVDDGIGENILSLSGADKGHFAIVDGILSHPHAPLITQLVSIILMKNRIFWASTLDPAVKPREDGFGVNGKTVLGAW